MELPFESDQPGTAGDKGSPGQEGVTAERLKKIIRNMETGFYDSSEVREHIARRVREELDP